MTRVAAAILAAGQSRRLGCPKQLLPVRGTMLVRAIAGEVLTSGCDHTAVILGAHADHIAHALSGLPVAIVHNEHWCEGMASSIRAATAWAIRQDCDAIVLCVCDQPALSGEHVRRLITSHRELGRPVGSRYDHTVGVPAVFGADDFARLLALTGDTGARGLLRGAAAIDWPAGACDLDTPEVARHVLGLSA
jgi:molybdenum cofactor cytidylyltransferase